MTIKRAHQMSLKQLEDLEALMAKCQKVDRNTIPIYKHLIDKLHTLPCNILYYENGNLVGYLRSFFFYANACEIALMVDPASRRRGIARAMLKEIIPMLQIEQIQTLYFSTPKDLNQTWFTQLGLSFHGSERQMQYDPQKPVSVSFKPAAIRLAVLKDVLGLVELDNTCFPNKKPDAEEVFRNLLSTANCSIFTLTQDQRIVGKAHVFKESDRARITDIGVFPEYRGRGFASTLIKYCINHALINNKPKIVLDVEVANESALKLYDGLGFQITNAHDYWSTPKDALEFGLSALLCHSDTNHGHAKTEKHKKDTP
ncbi:MAG: GNAT family N-acetyltransferase [Legionellaceae bacterium]|nr:GNAT family N-acetyltransferase [Legionellaceae bacterium]MBP9774421.1 GNAT family N-acetyltransferase [Legionellaceae bacterium]